MPEFNVSETQVTISSVGVAGPPGPVGPQGPQGVKGDPGGFDNSILHEGDLNDLVVPGLYMLSWAAAQVEGNHSPVKGEGHVEVTRFDVNYVLQEFTVANRLNPAYGERYTRVLSPDADWSPWVKTLDSKFLHDKLPVLSKNLIHSPTIFTQPPGNAFWQRNAPGNYLIEDWAGLGAGVWSIGVRIEADATAPYQGIQAVNKVSVEAGKTYTLSCYIHANKPGSIRLGFSPMPPTQSQPVTPWQWKRYSVTYTVPETTTVQFLYIDTGPTAQDMHFYLTGVQFEESPYPTVYFDGDTRGAYWSGTPNASESILFAESREQQDLRVSRHETQYHLSGQGYPEGNIVANIGRKYTDTAATNGAVEWTKTKNNGEATGWKVTCGDTGYRNIQSLYINGVTPGPDGPENTTIRRVNDTVEILLSFYLPENWVAGTSIILLPEGFRPAGVFLPFADYSTGQILSTVNDQFEGFKVYWGYTPNPIRTRLTYLTNDQWPWTLPGTQWG